MYLFHQCMLCKLQMQIHTGIRKHTGLHRHTHTHIPLPRSAIMTNTHTHACVAAGIPVCACVCMCVTWYGPHLCAAGALKAE